MPIAEIRRQADNQDMPQHRHHHQIAAISRVPLEIPSFTMNQTSTTGPNLKAKSNND